VPRQSLAHLLFMARTCIAAVVLTALAVTCIGTMSSDDVAGRRLGGWRRRRRALADARALHNDTAARLPEVAAQLESTAATLRMLGRPQLDDARCHTRPHTGYSGDGAAVWGLNFKLRDAGECCAACKAHQAVCSVADSQGKSWWPDRPELRCGRNIKQACTIWTFCPQERCFAFDIHKHTFGECWLKFQNDLAPTMPAGPSKVAIKDAHFGRQVYPEVMRHAPRKIWPWPVAEKVWEGPMPQYVPWTSGVVADASVEVSSGPPNDRWKERWCKKHGPCDGESF